MSQAFQTNMFGADEPLAEPAPDRPILRRRHYAPVTQTELCGANELVEYPELPILAGVDLSQADVAILVDRPEKQVAEIENAFRAALVRIAQKHGAQPTQADLDGVFKEWERRRMAELERYEVRRFLKEQK